MPEDTVIICQHEDIAQIGFLFDEAYVILCRKQVGFGDLVASAYLATDVFLRELQVVCQVPAFSSGYFVQLPRDFRHFPESMEIIPVYTQFGDVEVLVGIELQVAVQ